MSIIKNQKKSLIESDILWGFIMSSPVTVPVAFALASALLTKDDIKNDNFQKDTGVIESKQPVVKQEPQLFIK